MYRIHCGWHKCRCWWRWVRQVFDIAPGESVEGGALPSVDGAIQLCISVGLKTMPWHILEHGCMLATCNMYGACACMLSCVRAYMLACVRTYVPFVCACCRDFVHACFCACGRVCFRTYVSSCFCACVRVCLHACLRACVCACVHACVCACVRVCVRVHACVHT